METAPAAAVATEASERGKYVNPARRKRAGFFSCVLIYAILLHKSCTIDTH